MKIEFHYLKFVGFFSLILFSSLSCTSDVQEDNINTSNMLYEILFDSSIRKGVKELDFIGSDLKLGFDCEGQLKSMSFPSENSVFNYQYQGDTIINQLSDRQRSMYILNTENKITESQSQLKLDGNWILEYREFWSYNQNGFPEEKIIQSPAEKKAPYFINRERYNYDREGKVEILKYGKDNGSGRKNGLLRTETRYANSYGDWTSIAELDEDNIPFRNSSFIYEYDNNGNWTQVIVQEKNNYTNKTSTDTIRRKINYFSRKDCL